MKIIDKIAWIEIKSRKVLVAKSYNKDNYYLPGGKREENENDEQTLIREISEELTVHIKQETIEFIGVFEAQADEKPDGVYVKMTCYAGDYTGELKENAEIETLAWFNSKDVDKISAVSKLIFAYLKEQDLID